MRIFAPLALLSVLATGCGVDAASSSQLASCGQSGLVDDGDPSTDWSGPFDGNFQDHKLHIDLAGDGRHATLVIDGGQALDLGLVARLYCSDSIGMFGDGPTRVESKTLVTLFRTPDNVRTVKVNRWAM
jgi:hypothetical protein